MRYSAGSLKKGKLLRSEPMRSGSAASQVYYKIVDAAGTPVSLTEFGSSRKVAKLMTHLRNFYDFHYGCIRGYHQRALYYLVRE